MSISRLLTSQTGEMAFTIFKVIIKYSLVANRRGGVGIVFPNINRRGSWNSRGLKIFPNINSRGGGGWGMGGGGDFPKLIFLITSRKFSSTTHCYYISHEMFTIYCEYFPCIRNNSKFAHVSFRMFFVRRLCSHFRMSGMEKN